MIFAHSLVATLLASASLVLALPALDRDVVNLSVRDDDYDVEYKRSSVETFVCKRDGDNQSLSCLRKKSDTDAADADADQSKTANVY